MNTEEMERGADMRRNSEPLRGWKRRCVEESAWGEQEKKSTPDSRRCSLHQALHSFDFPPIFLGYITDHIFNNYPQRKDTWRLQTTWLWSETGKVTCASVLRNVPKSAPSEEPSGSAHKAYADRILLLFLNTILDCLWVLLIHGMASTISSLYCLNELKGQGRWGEAEMCSASILSKDMEVGHGTRIAPWSCCFSVCMCVFYNWWNDTNLTPHFSGHVNSTPKCIKYSKRHHPECFLQSEPTN